MKNKSPNENEIKWNWNTKNELDTLKRDATMVKKQQLCDATPRPDRTTSTNTQNRFGKLWLAVMWQRRPTIVKCRRRPKMVVNCDTVAVVVERGGNSSTMDVGWWWGMRWWSTMGLLWVLWVVALLVFINKYNTNQIVKVVYEFY